VSPPSPERDLALNYLALRKLVGALGLALPFALLLGGRLLFGLRQQETISHYHDAGMRDVFVGLLCALGVFLLAYRGYGPKDFHASRIAGVAAIVVAVFPHARPEAGAPGFYLPVVHFAAAGVFFVTVALTSIFLFTKSDQPKEAQPLGKRRRNAVYLVCGWGILASIALIGLDAALAPLALPTGSVFWLETLAVLFFGAAWMAKGGVLESSLATPPVQAFFTRGEAA
jgi:hypothetical protein